MAEEDEDANSIENWTKYAIVVIKESWPKEIRDILEPACIALGGFTTRCHFNVNYFDHAGFKTVATQIDILNFWLQVCIESIALDEKTGAVVRLPTLNEGDVAEWQARFGHTCKLAAATMQDLARGKHRTNLTKFLARPHPDAYLMKPSNLFPEFGATRLTKLAPAGPSAKPDGHKGELLKAKDANLPNRSSLRTTRAPFDPELKAKIELLPASLQPSEIAVSTIPMLTQDRKEAARQAREARKRKQQDASGGGGKREQVARD